MENPGLCPIQNVFSHTKRKGRENPRGVLWGFSARKKKQKWGEAGWEKHKREKRTGGEHGESGMGENAKGRKRTG
jgi:hypothetical protein